MRSLRLNFLNLTNEEKRQFLHLTQKCAAAGASDNQELAAVLAEMRLIAGDKVDWNNPNQTKFCITYDHANNAFDIAYAFSVQGYGVYFASREDAKRAIEQIGVDRLKKVLFEVKQ